MIFPQLSRLKSRRLMCVCVFSFYIRVTCCCSWRDGGSSGRRPGDNNQSGHVGSAVSDGSDSNQVVAGHQRHLNLNQLVVAKTASGREGQTGIQDHTIDLELQGPVGDACIGECYGRSSCCV